MVAKTKQKGHALNLRVQEAAMDRADALIAHHAETTGGPSTRSDVCREAMMRGLRSMEAEMREAGKKASS